MGGVGGGGGDDAQVHIELPAAGAKRLEKLRQGMDRLRAAAEDPRVSQAQKSIFISTFYIKIYINILY